MAKKRYAVMDTTTFIEGSSVGLLEIPYLPTQSETEAVNSALRFLPSSIHDIRQRVNFYAWYEVDSDESRMPVNARSDEVVYLDATAEGLLRSKVTFADEERDSDSIDADFVDLIDLDGPSISSEFITYGLFDNGDQGKRMITHLKFELDDPGEKKVLILHKGHISNPRSPKSIQLLDPLDRIFMVKDPSLLTDKMIVDNAGIWHSDTLALAKELYTEQQEA